jgi:hypothetical protein
LHIFGTIFLFDWAALFTILIALFLTVSKGGGPGLAAAL